MSAAAVSPTETSIVRPTTLAEALAAKAEQGRAVTVLAGGTDLMVGIRPGERRFRHVLDLWRVDALRGITRGPDGGLRIGALTTFGTIIRSEALSAELPMLQLAARSIGAEQIQSRATLGGNVVNASPAADSVPVLSACDATLVLASAARGERAVSIHDFYRGYKDLDLGDDELLVRVELPPRPAGAHGAFRKVGTRAAQSISKVVVAMRAVVEGGSLKQVALSAGSVAPTVIRLRETEQHLAGVPVNAVDYDAVRAAVHRDVRPIGDIRSTEQYRRRVSGNVVVRMLRDLATR